MAIENSGDGERIDTLLPTQFQIVRSERVAGLNVRNSANFKQKSSKTPVLLIWTVQFDAGNTFFENLRRLSSNHFVWNLFLISH